MRKEEEDWMVVHSMMRMIYNKLVDNVIVDCYRSMS